MRTTPSSVLIAALGSEAAPSRRCWSGRTKRISVGSSSRPLIASGGPEATIAWSTITATRSARNCASSMKRVEEDGLPVSHRLRIVVRAWRRACGSKPVVGSSRNRTSGSLTRPSAQIETPALAARQVGGPRVALGVELDEVDQVIGLSYFEYQRPVISSSSPTVSSSWMPADWSTTPIRSRNARGPLPGS